MHDREETAVRLASAADQAVRRKAARKLEINNEHVNMSPVGILGGERIYILRMNATGNMLTHTPVNLPQNARIRTLVQGPDGFLYAATDSDSGQIWRLTPQ
jgi:hypothetical protein